MSGLMLFSIHPIRESVGGACGDIMDAAIEQCSSIGIKITEAVTGGGLVQEAMDGSGINIVSVMQTGVKALQSTGYAICALFFIIALLELAMSERMTMEFFIKFFAKFVIGVAAVFYSDKFVEIAWNFGDTLSTYLSNQSLIPTGETGEVVQVGFHDLFITYLNEVQGSQWLTMFGVVIGLGIPAALASFVIIAVVYVICFTRLLEIMVRGVFMPVACAMLSDDGWRGAGGRYIRKFLGICAQGAVMVIIGKLAGIVMAAVCKSMKATMTETVETAIANAGTKPGFGFVIEVVESTMAILGIAVACISLMHKSIGIVNDAFGG